MNALLHEHVGEFADLVMELLIGQSPLVTRLAFPDDRGFVTSRAVEMGVETVIRGVRLPSDEPLGKRLVPFENF